MIRILTSALLLLAVSASWAAEPEDVSWYDVEVIVFKNNTAEALNTEVWPEDPGQVDPGQAVGLTAPDAAASGPQPFQQLAGKDFRLGGAAARLAVSPGRTPLLHIAWRQPVSAQGDAPAVHIHSEDLPLPPAEGAPDETGADALPPARTVDGVIRLSRNRYLHLDIDLLYRKTQAGEVKDEPAILNLFRTEVHEPGLFRMQQSRRVRSEELHYFDHPAFGLLVLLTPYEPAGAHKDATRKRR